MRCLFCPGRSAHVDCGDASGLVLDEQAVSPNSPVVTITAPTQVVTWTTASNTLTWTASDADGDPLRYAVFYSNNGGEVDAAGRRFEWRILQCRCDGDGRRK
jgi:hypothetical protein